MFRIPVTVPHITTEQRAQFERMVPGIFTVASIPVIETEDQAVFTASRAAEKFLTTSEYISRAESIELTEEGWKVVLIAAGD